MNPDPAHYLPHRYPFLLLDRIVELEKGVRAVARYVLSADKFFPSILMIESVAQLAGIVVAQTKMESGFLAAVNHADFSGSAVGGDILTISAMLTKSFGRLFIIDGNVFCDRGKLLSVQLTIGVGTL